MFVHAVYFWGKPGLTAADRWAWEQGLHTLPTIEVVEEGYVGVPADTHRDVVENTYSYALVLLFRDKDAHDAYQVHPVHQQFVADCARYWLKVRVHDSVAIPSQP
jgi:hypothetical protein